MTPVEAIGGADHDLDALQRLNAAAPANTTYLAVGLPPFKTYRDRQVIGGLESMGWRLIGVWERTAYLERPQHGGLPTRLANVGA